MWKLTLGYGTQKTIDSPTCYVFFGMASFCNVERNCFQKHKEMIFLEFFLSFIEINLVFLTEKTSIPEKNLQFEQLSPIIVGSS
jgi:hypothetical protein